MIFVIFNFNDNQCIAYVSMTFKSKSLYTGTFADHRYLPAGIYDLCSSPFSGQYSSRIVDLGLIRGGRTTYPVLAL